MCHGGSGVLCKTVVRGRGQAPRETLAQQVGHLAQPVPRRMGRQACSSSGGWGSGWACFPTLGITPAGWGEGGRAGVRGPEPVIQAVRAERSCRGSLDLSTRRLLEQFNPATCPFIPQAGQLCLPSNTCNWDCPLVQNPK